MIYIYLIQVFLGIFLWRRFKFSWSDSVLFSLMLLPNIILVSVKLFDFCACHFNFAKKVETEESDVKCTGNNDNGCFMDSCSINCNCEGLKEFGEKLKNKKLW